MQKQLRPSKVFVYQSIGFLAIITVCLLDELIGLTSLVLGNQLYIADFRGTILKALLILGVWLIVARSTRRVIARIQYLEGFMKVCAWCHRIEYQSRWMPIDEFLHKGFDTPTSHGICTECQEKMKAAMNRARQSNAEATADCGPGGKANLEDARSEARNK